MCKAAEEALSAILGNGFQLITSFCSAGSEVGLFLLRKGSEKMLFVFPAKNDFEGLPLHQGIVCPLTWRNVQSLMVLIPELRPKRVPFGTPSFGFGDRLGLATPGHVKALEGAKVFPILAQQSMRENARTGRSFADVIVDAVFGVLQAGWNQGFGADADHLKSVEEAYKAARLGYTMFTCDPSDFLISIEKLSEEELRQKLRAIPLTDLENVYLKRSFTVPGLGRLRFSRHELVQIALKFWKAIGFVDEMYQTLQKTLPQGFDFEVSLDEAFLPTSPKEHLFWVLELRRRGVKLTSFAPRFPGVMEKAVDYQGDLEEFRQALRAHVAIARGFGPYRISLHSGSDKWSLYPLLAQETDGLWHVKTAGTSYLLALEVLARFSPAFFREILFFACERFPVDRQGYQVSAELPVLPNPQDLHDQDLLKLLKNPSVRQVLHVTFGAVMQKYGDDLKQKLLLYEETYHEILAKHLGKHLEALGVKDHG